MAAPGLLSHDLIMSHHPHCSYCYIYTFCTNSPQVILGDGDEVDMCTETLHDLNFEQLETKQGQLGRNECSGVASPESCTPHAGRQ